MANKKILTIAIAQRRRIEEPANDASDDEGGENIGDDASESRPTVKPVSDLARSNNIADYGACPPQ
jgi:hypothetical protein